jgi:hypothetical protein
LPIKPQSLALQEVLRVPRGGFEPPAYPLGGDRSIQLSYRGRRRDCGLDGCFVTEKLLCASHKCGIGSQDPLHESEPIEGGVLHSG